MNKQTFENYLSDIHLKQNPEILGDDLPDRFYDWLAELDVDDVIKYADEFAIQNKKELLEWVDLEIEAVMKILKK